ncbi:MAG: PAS domain S-box protein [Coleofasciculus sp. B1-GNL1-01]|uniref:sensor histidine kinase n=1 Tax=Coleofasciculus sp. B1-GNL1-01 TaxID=3068484 RepID=UPI0032F52CF7
MTIMYIPHGHCYLWQTNLVGLHVIADGLIALAYYSIPVTLLYFIQKRQDVPFKGVFWLFSAFIISCGTTHLMGIVTLWHPIYWVSGLIKAITALISIYTALAIIPMLPQALTLPSPAKLKQINDELAAQIAQREQIEASLRETQERFILAVRGSGDGLWDWNVLTQEVYYSPRLKQILGYEEQEGENYYNFWESRVHPDDRDRVMNAMQDHLENHVPYAIEYRLRQKSGDYCWIYARAQAIWDETGKPTRMAGSISDITDRKRAEEALQQSEAKYRALIDTTQTGYVVLDQQGIVLDANQEYVRVTGQSNMSDILGQPVLNWIAPYDLERNVAEIQKALVERSVQNLETDYCHANGTIIPIEINAKVIDTDEGCRILALCRDITERKQARQELKAAIADLARSNQDLEQFAYVASHDLREPLRKIRSYSDLLVKRYRGKLDERADKYIAYITDATQRMQSLISDLLTYSRVSKPELIPEPTDLGHILKKTLADLSPLIKENKAIITTDSLPKVNANPTQMAQLLQNLITNGIKFRTQQPPRIHITATREGQFWQIAVQDNGIGMESQYRDRIFVIFQRLHYREEYPGTGIGLAVCKKIVERHGGQIWVESELGQGSTFYFTLPAV